MKITLFTSNNIRHVYLINLLSKICDELCVVIESRSIFKKNLHKNYSQSDLMKKYFEKVDIAQNNLYKKNHIIYFNNNIKIFPIMHGDLNFCIMNNLSEFLYSDYYIVFGSSFIKGDLINFLIEKKAINIHAGISPYYRGADCNFWALYDNNPHLVGATIHMISKGLDNGPILYHAMSNHKNNPFEYTMSTLKSAFHSIAERINDKTIFDSKPIIQDKSKEIRYTKKIDFNEEILKNYFCKDINLESKKFDSSLLHRPYFYK